MKKEINLNEQFDYIYKHDIWKGGSGDGSFAQNTVAYRRKLSQIIKQKDIKTIVDIGCGDWQIMSLVDIPENKNYTGYDVANFVIEKNKSQYTKENVFFKLYDGDFSKVESADLCIIKDVLQHLDNSRILSFIEHMSKFRYVLITNCVENRKELAHQGINQEIQAGGWRPLDLTQYPFNLKMETVLHYHGGGIKKTHLWKNPER